MAGVSLSCIILEKNMVSSALNTMDVSTYTTDPLAGNWTRRFESEERSGTKMWE